MAMMMNDETTMQVDRLFVYGTLKAGQWNDAFLRGAELLGAGKTEPKWNLVDLGAYPAMTYGHTAVLGEVYRVDADHMRHIDRLEGFPKHYTRNVLDITLSDGTVVSAWAYHIPHLAGTAKQEQKGVWP